MTPMYEHDWYTIKIHQVCENELPMQRVSKVITLPIYRQTDETKIIHRATLQAINNSEKDR